MKIKVNSTSMEMIGNQSVMDLLKELCLEQKSGMAVAVNAEVIPKKNWTERVLNENDEVIIIEAAQGG